MWRGGLFGGGRWGVARITVPGNCVQAFLFVLYNNRETLQRLLRINSCLASVPRLYIISKGTSARSERSGRHLRCAPLPSSSVNPVRIVKWKRSTRGGGLRSSLYYEVQRYENTWDGARQRAWQTPSENRVIEWERTGAGGGRFEEGDALFITVKHTAHWFNGNTILIFRSLKTKALFLTICHCLIG